MIYEAKDTSRKLRIDFLSAFNESDQLTRHQLRQRHNGSHQSLYLRIKMMEQEGLVTVTMMPMSGHSNRMTITAVQITEAGKNKLQELLKGGPVWQGRQCDEGTMTFPHRIRAGAQPCGVIMSRCFHSRGCYLRDHCSAAENA